MVGVQERSIDEALERFTLIAGAGSEKDNTACAMTLLAWVAGQAWTDHPECAHPQLANLAIQANDADGTSVEDRQAIVRAGETGVLDTWWVPGEVVVWAMAQVPRDASAVVRELAVSALITEWKQTKERPDLGGANLRDANLRDANLRDANLGGANLGDANLRGANLRDANLASAYGTPLYGVPVGWKLDESGFWVKDAP